MGEAARAAFALVLGLALICGGRSAKAFALQPQPKERETQPKEREGFSRAWQTGTWVDVGTKFTPFVGTTERAAGGTRSIPMPGQSEKVQVGTYIIETADMRLELQDLVPVGASGALESVVTIGGPVTFALDGKRTAYIRVSERDERRLLVVKKTAKKKP